ncbi:MAG: hypothetical protein SP4CHLAM5_11170 [Chlamydiia bacterium]|nr:hypothetical protein [Chlamydiia bacterium]MCH9618973.1 hypothetical protein [Chlamydiia bacterium]MCH9623815.1 hypothetical protein [Chlamydiia bacterium]
MSSKVTKRSSLKTLLIISAFIFADIVCENFIVIVNDQQSHTISTMFLFGFLLIQILFSPIQAGFSDFGRKKALIISNTISLLSLIFIYLFLESNLIFLSLLLIAISLKGFWGNTLAIAWGAIGDTQDKNYRSSFALGTGVYATAYLILIGLRQFTISNSLLFIATSSIIIISLLLSIFIFKDPEDKTVAKEPEIEDTKKSVTGIRKHLKVFSIILKEEKDKIFLEIKDKRARQALIAYLLWEISMYSILISQIDLNKGDTSNNLMPTLMMFGYLIGVFILRRKWFFRFHDSRVIKWGYYVSFFSLIPYFILFPFIKNLNIILGICYCLHALGNALLSPTLLTIVSKEREHHEQGKMLGLVESADTMAFMIAYAFDNLFMAFNLPLIYLIGFSFLSFTLSLPYYKRFKETAPQS